MSPVSTVQGVERLKEVWSRRKWPAILVLAAVLAAGGGLTVGLPDVYQSTATLRVEPPAGAALPGDREVETRLQLVTQRALSRARLADLARRLRLYEELRGKVSEAEILKRVRRDVRVELTDKETLGADRASATAFTVAFRGRDAALVAEAANTIASWYVDEDLRLRSKAADVLRGQVDDVRARLEGQEQRLGEFRSRHAGGLPQQLEVTLSTLHRLDTELRLVAESRLRALERRTSLVAQLAASDAAANRDPDSPEARLAHLRQQLADLRRAYTERHPDVGRLAAEISSLEETVAARRPVADGQRPQGPPPLLEASLREVEVEIQSLHRQEEALRRETTAYRQRLEAAPQQGQAFDEIARDYETTKVLYNGLLKRYEEARLASGAADGGGPFRILEPALPPQEAAGPNRGRLALMTLVLGAGLAGLLLALLEQTDTSFHSLDDLRGFTRVPVLVSVPRIAATTIGSQLKHGSLAASLVLGLAAVALLSYRLSGTNDLVISLVSRGR